MSIRTTKLIKQTVRLIFSVTTMSFILTIGCFGASDTNIEAVSKPEVIETIDLELPEVEMLVEEVQEPEEPEEPELPEPMKLTDEEIEMIAQLTMAEAEGESEYGQRLVIDTVLNRVDGKYWPDTVREVIYQPSQYSPMWNGRFERCHPRADLVQLVKEELIERTNSEVVFFRTRRYSDYGVPMFKEGHHYFSKYE